MMHTSNWFMQNPRFEIRIAGSGGQGIVLAGIILAEALLLDGKHVAQSQSYGPETRGGSSISEVVVGDGGIDYPRAVELDLLVALTQQACDQNLPNMKKDGQVIADSDLVRKVFWRRVARLPFQRIAEKTGEARAINMAALGAIAVFCPSLSSASLTEVMSRRLPGTKVAANILAFNEALKLAEKIKARQRPIDIKEEFEL